MGSQGRTATDKAQATGMIDRRMLLGASAAMVAAAGLPAISRASTAEGAIMEQVLTDFADGSGLVALRSWYTASDRVMGGASDMAAALEPWDGRMALRMSGHVSSANNGGFIMLGFRMAPGLDAAAWTGLRLTVRGVGSGYRVTLRTGDTRRPWETYNAPLSVEGGWRTVDLPFAAFTPSRPLPPLDLRTLDRVGIVAGGKDAPADIHVARAALYRA